MKKPDYRTVQDILKHPRWDTVIATLDLEGVTAPLMRVLDDFLAFLEGQELASIWSLKPCDFLSFDAGYQSANRLRALKRAMEAIFPNQPAILILTDAIRLKEAELRPQISRTGWKRSLKVTIPANDLPQDWQDALADMTAGFDRPGAGAPSLNMIPTYQMKLRQFAFSAGKAGLPAAFSVAAILAYVRDMRARGLAAATQRASVSALAKCGRYLAAGPDVMELLADLERTCEAKARKAPKQKYAKLQKTGYSPVAVIDRAGDILDEAHHLQCPKSRQAQRNCAAALALFSVLPVRLADTRLKFGENLTWADGVYELGLTLSKSGEPYDTEIDPRLNRFIDALILRGCDEAWLDHMRAKCMASNRPLFVRNDGEGVGYNYVSDCWRSAFGTGEHIARTILHTFLGVELGVEGTDMALAANGQTSPETAAAYQDDMVKKAQRLKGQESLADIAKDADQALFEFR